MTLASDAACIATPVRPLLAKVGLMRELIPVSLGAAAGVVVRRERQARTKAERLSAATLETLLDAIEANDAVTGAHVRRVAAYSLILGESAGVDEKMLHSIERIALFHDIGKLHEALTDIFHDEAKLTPEERRAVRTHPERGAEVLGPLLPGWQRLSSWTEGSPHSAGGTRGLDLRQLRRDYAPSPLQPRPQLR